MVKTKRTKDMSRLGSSRSTSTGMVQREHAPIDLVAPKAPPKPMPIPSVDRQTRSDSIQDSASPLDSPSPHDGLSAEDGPSAHVAERKVYWMVDVIDEQGVKKKQKLRLHDVWSLPAGRKVVLPFDRFKCPITDAAALYGQFLGGCGRDTKTFPIHYEDWRKINKERKKKYFRQIILPKFYFEDVDMEHAMDYTLKLIGRKRHDYKLELWNSYNDPLLSRQEMQNKVPLGVDLDQWACYVNYRFDDKTKEMCRKNKENRKKLKVPHTGGSKSLPRRRAEMEVERGQLVDRGELYIVTHKKKDGKFVNIEAEGKIMKEMSQNPPSQSDTISQDDALGRVLGAEHCGRVRSIGFGPTPSSVFGMPAGGYGSISSSFASASSSNNSQMQEKVKSLESELESERKIRRMMELKLEAEQERISALEGALASTFQELLGRVPQQLVNLLSHPPMAPNHGSEGSEGSGGQAARSMPSRFSKS